MKLGRLLAIERDEIYLHSDDFTIIFSSLAIDFSND
jgi:hypothetical protein